ncbi:hypothetical protein ASG43_09200 [Aureimonas sp. Leaf454]|uniref:ATP-binding protein n=1 Tax=Aureimonas sp. Leaf454 TaxID=1736381 RepID=UPI0006FF0A35|nr:ATP-binding protein [Aureimonas sp. Leaf454]KQT48997.1 hypothetical protein ASG43_09200 [Aureimonas sp. Leaf454]
MSNTEQSCGLPDVAAIVAARRGEMRQEIVRSMAKVRAAYVTTTRDRLLREGFDEFLDLVLGTSADGRREDGRCFFVTGESGAGKSRSIRRLFDTNEALAPIGTNGRVYVPWVSVKGPSPSTLQRLGLRILREVGYPLKLDTPESRVWEILGDQLRLRRILVVHIDEAQHLARSMKSEFERKAVANALKDILEHKGWPVSFVLSGIPTATEIARVDPQIERRGRFLAYPSLDMTKTIDCKIVQAIVRKLADAATLRIDGLTDSLFEDRLCHAANHQIGRVAQIVAGAIHKALVRGSSELTSEDFVNAYRSASHTTGLDELNPFLASDWKELPAGSFLIATES